MTSTAGLATPITAQYFGLALLFATAVIWTVSSFISESLVRSSDDGKAVVSPFLLTFLGTTLFTLYLPGVHLKRLIEDYWSTRRHGREGMYDRHVYTQLNGKDRSQTGNVPEEVPQAAADASSHSMGDKQIMVASALACPLWFLAQFAFNTSLAYTSVTSNTILSSTSSLFTFGLSMLLLGEKYTNRKLLCIAACIGGTALVTVADAHASADDSKTESQRTVFGDILVLTAAGLYAAYTVVMRTRMPGEENAEHVAVFFGFIGLFNTVCLGPLVLILAGAGRLKLSEVPRTSYYLILLEGLLDYALADFLWAQAVLLLGPTVATLGLSIQIPLATVADLFLGQPRWLHNGYSAVMTVGGTILIMAGFFGAQLGAQTSPVTPAASIRPQSHSTEDRLSPPSVHEQASLLQQSKPAVPSHIHHQQQHKA